MAKQENHTEESKETKSKAGSWLKKLGFAGFMFFFIKGMGWIALAVVGLIWGPEALESIKSFFTDLF